MAVANNADGQNDGMLWKAIQGKKNAINHKKTKYINKLLCTYEVNKKKTCP